MVVAMLRTRRLPMLVMLLLAATAAVAAMAGPAYERSVDAGIAANEFNAAPAAERTLDLASPIQAGAGGTSVSALGVMEGLLPVHGFTWVASTSFTVASPAVAPNLPKLVATIVNRQDQCAHVTIVAGRCAVGLLEVVLPRADATILGVRPGDVVPLAFADESRNRNGYVPVGAPTPVTVVGIYAPVDPGGSYWGATGYFGPGQSGPILATSAALDAFASAAQTVAIDAVADAHTFHGDLSALNAEVNNINTVIEGLQSSVTLNTQMPDLIHRIQDNQRSSHEVVPVGSAPLLLLAWFVVFLAAAYAAAGRRAEFAIMALRGVPRPLRWGLGIGEHLVPIVAGTLAVTVVGALVAPVPVLYPAIALAGSLLAAALAQIPVVGGSVQRLMRQAATAGGRTSLTRTGEALVVSLAVAGIIQARTGGDRLTGLTVVVPALTVLGAAVIASAALGPLSGWFGRRSLRRGRVATALAAYTLSRRPGARRILILLTVAIGLLGFAAASLSVAARDRQILARVQTGASTILTVDTATRVQLINGVHAADPDGRWAMAAVGLSEGSDETARVLAVDSPRLAAVADWLPQFGSTTPAQVAALLHPAEATSAVHFTGTSVAVDFTVTDLDDRSNIAFGFVVVPDDGEPPVAVTDQIFDGPQRYQRPVPCAAGCRLEALQLSQLNGGLYDFTVTVGRVTAGAATVDLADAARWTARGDGGVRLTASPAGLAIHMKSPASTVTDNYILPAAMPSPLPMVTSGSLSPGSTIDGLDGKPLAVHPAGHVVALPRFGQVGGFIDLQYADLSTIDNGGAINPQVWIGPHAPADALARLARNGIVVTGSTDAADAGRTLAAMGAQQALLFQWFAAVIALGLSIGAMVIASGVDRRPRSQELSSMRVQGVSARVASRAAVAGYLVMVVAAAVIGVGAAALSWWLCGRYLPIYADPTTWPPQRWPGVGGIAEAWAAGVGTLLVVALLIGRDLRRSVDALTRSG
jgi:hypothetical protein